MDVATIGGGPGGLYASLLLKRTHPDWTVTVHERNPPDVTYGWGIVLPKRTLSKLAEADGPSHDAIDGTATRWEPFDLYYGGERYRSHGHTFLSMMRTDLLALLQERCAEVGVELVFDHAVEDPDALAADADLVIAADGIHSGTREAFADEFGAETIDGETRFSWFGTDADFEALSHIFVENDDGIWCAHTYPGETSTFIVDCDRETWTNARLDERPEEEYLAYLEDVFADHLDGHDLLSQQDKWRTFTTVTNDRWHHGNVVLLGDAAHTAHYSIGSGTTIALEDAIGLADALDGFDGDVESALSAYESERRPASRSLQRAAERSRLHFEHIRRFFDLPGVQFALHHMTRTGRISYASMRRRDPDLVDQFDRWFAAATPGGPDEPASVSEPSPPLTRPLDLRGLRLRRRTVSVAGPTTSSVEGAPSDPQLAAFGERAASDAGLAITEPLAVSRDGRITPGSPGLYEDAHADAWRDAVDAARAPTGTQLVHAGDRGAVQPRAFALEGPTRRNESWAPRIDDRYPNRPGTFSPGAMTREDLARVKRSFVDATERADDAGFDYLQLQFGNGYLPGSFLSPVTNDRADEYGGPVADRLRFPLEIAREVRAAWPESKPLGVALQATDWADGGLTLEESFEVGRALVDAGVDLLAPVAGGVSPHESPDDVEGLANYGDHLRNELDVPTMATVGATTADEVNTLVATGRADLCTYYGEPGADR
ncbi:oxidoreductase [Halorarum salinum]|uniref:FAD-dependent monooxygenase n=1 Tax=Halorarum salinum TaxID=2743089 RepID=A0A7D5QFB4_9EURY|nr:FAD-dependent monooxygenase [Halobaculum salinum]QLG61262.1 FAD-dependent monooxygenase [Halobaculum salinum]